MKKECINKTHVYDYKILKRLEKIDDEEFELEYIKCKRCGDVWVISVNTNPFYKNDLE
tara:strand:- start:5 stop:178 length:174 start_codon:yes stop_codon:yes gene_type:complete